MSVRSRVTWAGIGHRAVSARSRGSRTAEMVAATRARHLLRHAPPWIVEDPFAIHLAGRWRRIIESDLLDWLYSRVLLGRLMSVGVQQLVRARFAEDAITAAGLSQLVILGSGFDTFALRHPGLPLTVFEVDLAATEALKRERLAAAGVALPESALFVEVDFERDDLGERLTAAGFDRERAAFFNWMGVTYYLAPEALRESLRVIAELAAPGSELTLDYLIAAEALDPAARRLSRRMKRFVALRGEPMVTGFHPARVEAELGEGWELVEHESPAEQTERYLKGRADLPPLAPLFGCLRLRRKPRG